MDRPHPTLRGRIRKLQRLIPLPGGAIDIAAEPAARTGISGNRYLMAQTFACLYGSGAILVALTLAVGAPGQHAVPIAAIALAALVVTAVCVLARDRLPLAFFRALPLAGIVFVAVLLYAGGPAATGAYAILFFWVVVLGFYFFSPAFGILCSALASLSYAAVLHLRPGVEAGPLKWMILTGAMFVAGALVGRLRARAERLLEQLADAQHLAHIGSWEWDMENDSLSWSAETYRIFGLDPKDGPPSHEERAKRIYPDDREAVEEALRKLGDDRAPLQFEYRILRPDGRVRTLQAHSEISSAGDGSRIARGTVQDVTDRKRAERHFSRLLETAPDAMLIVDDAGSIVLANQQTERIFGYTRDSLLGEPVELLVPAGLPAGRGRESGEEQFGRSRDGNEFPAEISISPLETEDGVLISASIRDITERKQAAAETERLKSEFFGLVSHELRTPLTSIEGYADLLLEQEAQHLSEDGRGFLQVISRNTRRLDRLVQDLLLVTQVEAGTFEILVGKVEAAELARECELEAKARAEQADIELTVSAEHVPPFAGDHDRLAQVLDNFVSNAIKFTPPGGHIEVRVHSQGEACVIEVSDSGVGIPSEEVPHLFDRFYRSQSAGDAHIQGVGLGLAITKAIVDQHEGTIEVLSEPGAGSTFRVRVPLEPIESGARQATEAIG
jgi:protein-histidine pros-kinase